MEYAIVTISGSRANAKHHAPIVAGTVGGTVSFQFDASWDGYQKTLVWRGSGVTVDDTACTGIIPAEVVAAPGRLFVGVYGTKDNAATPTTWADLGNIMPGADPSGDPTTDPTLPVWAQIKQDMIDDQTVGASAWSSKNTVDKLCPSFTASGPVVACEPMEGYPLTVQADDATEVYRCGKNLLKPRVGITTADGITFNIHKDGTVVLNGTATKDTWAYIAERVSVKKGVTYTLSGCTDGAYNKYQIAMADGSAIGLYNANAPATSAAKASGDVPCRMYVYAGTTVNNLTIRPQLEVGSVATEPEVYKETDIFSQGEAIPALDGVNTIWADSGDVTVTGKADPKALFEKLTNAILSLGGNV